MEKKTKRPSSERAWLRCGVCTEALVSSLTSVRASPGGDAGERAAGDAEEAAGVGAVEVELADVGVVVAGEAAAAAEAVVPEP